MMLVSFSALLSLLLLPHLVLSSEKEKLKLDQESLQFIHRVPCSEPQGRCSFQDFAELRGEKDFLKEWMVVLFNDFDKYSSHDIIVDILRSHLHVKLFRHKILIGRVACSSAPAGAKLCKDMDPTVIYAFQNGQKTDYWWTVSDFVNNGAFVLGNLLTLQYSEYMENTKTRSFDKKTLRNWRSDRDIRKFMLVVHLAEAGLEVNATDRVRAFDLLGVIYRTIPNVRIIVVSGVIKTGVEFWWYDSRWCPKLDGPGCEDYRIHLFDFSMKDADQLLCEIEKFSAGLDIRRSQIDLSPNSETSHWEESNHRLLLACPFFFFKVENEKLEDIQHIMNTVVPAEPREYEYVAITGDRKLALSTLISHGADLELVNAKMLIKYHTNDINKTLPHGQTHTDVFSRKTTPAGLQVQFIAINDSEDANAVHHQVERTFLYSHYTTEYEHLGNEFSPYKETDELSLILSSSKSIPSQNFVELTEKEFERRTASDQPPATVLFFVHWSSASLVAKDIVFPSASNELMSRYNRSGRLYSIDCFSWNELCQRQGINQYPTVKFFVQGSTRRLETVVSLAEILRETVMMDLDPLLETRTPEDVERALNLSAQLMDHAVLGVGIEDAQVLEAFRKTAAAFKGKALFVLMKHRDLPQKLQARIADRSIASYSVRLRPDLIATAPPLHEDLARFITEARFDRVMELTWILFQEVRTTKRPLLLLLVLEMTPRLECLLSTIAVRRRGQFHVTWLHVSNNAFPIFKDVKHPTVLVLQAGAIHRWAVNPLAGDDEDCPGICQELGLWLDNIKEGKMKPSEFVTENNYPPEGLHINCVDDVYPRPNSKVPEAEKSPESHVEDISDSEVMEEEENRMTKDEPVPKMTPVESSIRDEL